MTSDERVLRQLLTETGALVVNTHVKLASGRHSDRYIEKTALLRRADHCQVIADMIVQNFINKGVEVVIGPAIGAVGLAAIVALRMSQGRIGSANVEWGFAEPVRDSGGQLVLYELKRGFAQMVEDKRVLVVEDIVTSGISSNLVVKAVRANRGKVVGLGVIINRGRVTSADVGHPGSFRPLMTVDMPSYDSEDCPLCLRGLPISTQYGHGGKAVLPASI